MSNAKLNFKTFQDSRKPKTLFNDMTNLVDMVQSGVSPSLIISGMPGLGKTFLTTKKLKDGGYKEGVDYIHLP